MDNRPLWIAAAGAVAALAIALASAEPRKGEAKLRFAVFVPNVPAVTLRIYPEADDEAGGPEASVEAAYASVTPYLALPAGRYRIEALDGDRPIASALYGLGVSRAYTLALFGYQSPPSARDSSVEARLSTLLGGTDVAPRDDLMLQHRMILERPPVRGAHVRAYHFAPGLGPLDVRVADDADGARWPALAYPQKGGPRRVLPPRAHLTVRASDAPEPLAFADLAPAENSLTTIFLAADLGEGTGLLAVVARASADGVRRPTAPEPPPAASRSSSGQEEKGPEDERRSQGEEPGGQGRTAEGAGEP